MAYRTPVRAHLRLQAVGKGDLLQALENFGAIPVVVGAVVEDEHYAGEAEERIGAKVSEVRQTVHLNFDGDGDLLFDFFGGAAGPLGDDLDIIVGDVGIGFHWKGVERNGAPNEEQDG